MEEGRLQGRANFASAGGTLPGIAPAAHLPVCSVRSRSTSLGVRRVRAIKQTSNPAVGPAVKVSNVWNS